MPASELQHTSEICLPKYNPDVAGVDATQWCATVDIILRGKLLSDTALSKALEGTAEQWLSQICYPGITWRHFAQNCVIRILNKFPSRWFLGTWLNSTGVCSE